MDASLVQHGTTIISMLDSFTDSRRRLQRAAVCLQMVHVLCRRTEFADRHGGYFHCGRSVSNIPATEYPLGSRELCSADCSCRLPRT